MVQGPCSHLGLHETLCFGHDPTITSGLMVAIGKSDWTETWFGRIIHQGGTSVHNFRSIALAITKRALLSHGRHVMI
jgi:hypothetical protein